MAGQDGPANSGIIAREAESARAAISAALSERGLTPRGPIDIRPVPFAGTWGVASSVAHQLAGDLAMAELEAAGKLEGLSRKEAKQLAGAATREKAQSLAAEIAEKVGTNNGFARVEAANGFINIYFDANAIAGQLISTVLSQGAEYGYGPERSERVLVEHSQPNTHKSFHVGHLRNSCIGIAVSNLQSAAGYPVLHGDLSRRHRHARDQVPLVLRDVSQGAGAERSAAQGVGGSRGSTPNPTSG